MRKHRRAQRLKQFCHCLEKCRDKYWVWSFGCLHLLLCWAEYALKWPILDRAVPKVLAPSSLGLLTSNTSPLGKEEEMALPLLGKTLATDDIWQEISAFSTSGITNYLPLSFGLGVPNAGRGSFTNILEPAVGTKQHFQKSTYYT